LERSLLAVPAGRVRGVLCASDGEGGLGATAAGRRPCPYR